MGTPSPFGGRVAVVDGTRVRTSPSPLPQRGSGEGRTTGGGQDSGGAANEGVRILQHVEGFLDAVNLSNVG